VSRFLPLLNKCHEPTRFEISEALQAGRCTPALGGEHIDVVDGGTLVATIDSHGVQAYVRDGVVTDAALTARLDAAMRAR
jgi:hypothetical protein